MATGLERSGQFLNRHSRTVTTAVVVGLAGFAVTAFGIAPLAPDAADLPSRIVTENVTPDDITSQLEALAAHDIELYRNDLTRSSDTADTLLARLNVVDAQAAAFIRSDVLARKLLAGRSGKMVQVRTDANGKLSDLVARYPAERPEQFNTHFARLTIRREGDGFTSQAETVPLVAQIAMGSGTIRNSLFAATDEARIPDPVAIQLAEIFSTDIDFHRELRRGDTFRVIYEALTADGEPISWNQASGRVLAAAFTNNGKTYDAVWFKGADGKGGYFDLDGQSKRRAFLAAPLAFSRVTSGFAMRFHPILGIWKKHNGVDYGAPTGTPVRTVGDGVVEFAGKQNGYGNVIYIKHRNDRETVYAHLSRIDVKMGQRVEQGERIGAVGMTGWATGPHLHFEFRVHGHQDNPLMIAKSSEPLTLGEQDKVRFMGVAQSAKAELDAAETINAGDVAE